MSTITTPKGNKAFFPDTQYFPASEILPDALVNTIATQGAVVEGDEPLLRIPVIGLTDDVQFVSEGTEIPQADPHLSEVIVSTGKIGLIAPITREASAYSGVENLLSVDMRRALTRKADAALLTNADHPTGLLNYPGVHDGGTMKAGDLDVLSDAITAVEAAGATVSHLVMDPASWGALRKLKTASGSAQLLLGNPAEQTTKQLFGIPVIVNNAVPAGTIVALDKQDIISASGQVRLDRSEHAAFTSDSILLRATYRFGAAPIHPEYLAKVTVNVSGK